MPTSLTDSGGPLRLVLLDSVLAFAQLEADIREELSEIARVEELAADEEVSSFGAALLLEGEASICATIVDAHAARASAGKLIPSCGSFGGAVPMRIVAGPRGAAVATWEQAVIDEALAPCPQVIEELVRQADRLQALAGATMGPLGELDDAARNLLLDRLTVRVVRPRELVMEAGAPLGIALVGVGAVELLEPGKGTVRPGELLFAALATSDLPAPCAARASAAGAILLVGDRSLVDELAAKSPAIGALFEE